MLRIARDHLYDREESCFGAGSKSGYHDQGSGGNHRGLGTARGWLREMSLQRYTLFLSYSPDAAGGIIRRITGTVRRHVRVVRDVCDRHCCRRSHCQGVQGDQRDLASACEGKRDVTIASALSES